MDNPPLPAGARRATIVTLSRVAGVAPSTVSRALKGDTRISPETRARIGRLAKELGYTPHASARTLSSGRSGLIGLVIGASSNPFYTELLHEAVRQAAPLGMRLLIIHAGPGPIENSTADALLQYQVDGCLMTSVELPSHAAAICAANGVPVVMVNRVARMNSSAVTCDNLFGAAQLARLLLEQGRRRLAVVRTSASSSTGKERERGFLERVSEWGREPPLLFDGRSTYEGGYEMAQRIADLPPAQRPEAVFAVSDIMAFGVLDGFRLRGVRVPQDIAVVGFDGLPAAARPCYDLTTVEQPLQAMIGRALGMLQARIGNPSLPDETASLRGRLLMRGSAAMAAPHPAGSAFGSPAAG
ncbi:LacI family transcriptional regulator [Roseomonas sp. M0104]|uniref:LacI family transcriptional regulator n=1 Tax=Teichococcus coralli TaxID=2545983 RepID=A0A845BFU4_9PROT|nr:LacI family DNA-binding transcriptional regulator [Pseudoroseomonas coralli]MXP64976.1 LacI family transcriptional regulator [Pseudoroseomonas coralli]